VLEIGCRFEERGRMIRDAAMRIVLSVQGRKTSLDQNEETNGPSRSSRVEETGGKIYLRFYALQTKVGTEQLRKQLTLGFGEATGWYGLLVMETIPKQGMANIHTGEMRWPGLLLDQRGSH
jgi:hypothetical protein